MAATRKLQGEIDRCLKKVTEGVETFEDIWQKVHNATNSNQKEKYEADLKKEIKKLQRLRDQIKSWIASGEIKDKSTLLDFRKLIETQMERFKVVERETKTKAYSKEGLGAAQKLDPAQKEREEISSWLVSSIDALNLQVDQFESEIESLLVGKKKRLDKEKQDRMEDLKSKLEKHRFHIKKLETLLRMLDNMSVEVDQIRRIKDDVEYYIDSSQEPGFEENEYIYDDIRGLDEIELSGVGVLSSATTDSNNSNDSASSPTSILSGASPVTSPALDNQHNHSTDTTDSEKKKKEEQTKPVKPMAVRAVNNSAPSLNSTGPLQPLTNSQPPMSTHNSLGVAPVTPNSTSAPLSAITAVSGLSAGAALAAAVTLPAVAALNAHPPAPQVTTATAPTAPTPAQPPAPTPTQPPAPAPTPAQPPAPAPAPAPTPAHHPQTQPQPPAHLNMSYNSVVENGPVSSPASHTHTTLTSTAPQLLKSSSPVTAALNGPTTLTSGAGTGGTSTPTPAPTPTPTPTQTQTSVASGARVGALETAGAGAGAGAGSPAPALSLVEAVAAAAADTAVAATLKSIAREAVQRAGLDAHHLQNRRTGPTLEAHIPPILGVAPLGPAPLHKEHQMQFQMMEAAYYHMPHPSDSERTRHYLPRNICQTPHYYAQMLMPHSETVEYFQRLSTETLFFVFYYMEGTKAQFLAAKALKKQSWRFHTKYMMWFQRHEEPKIINEEYEQGTYIYFDYEKWGQRKKEGFTFEYKYLEDRELN